MTWNPESQKILSVESGILGFGIRNTTEGNQNPTKDCNPESKFHWQILKRGTRNPESTAWNPESMNVLDSLTRGETMENDSHWQFFLLSPFFFLWNSPAETLALPLLFTPRQPPLCHGRVQKLTGLTLQSPKWNLNSDEKQFSITILRSQSNSPAETLTWPLLF